MRCLLAAILSLFAVASVHAGEAGPTGNWKVILYEKGQGKTFWIVQFDSKDGKVTGKAEAMTEVPPSTVDNIQMKGEQLSFAIKISNGPRFEFEGKVPAPGAKKVFGTLARDSLVIIAVLEATTAKTQFEINAEFVERTPGDPAAYSTVLELIRGAKGEKASPQDVQKWVEGVIQSSDKYGSRWQNEMPLRLVQALIADYPEQALAVGKKVEATLDPKAPAAKQIQLLSVIQGALKKTGKDPEAKGMETRIEKLEEPAYVEHAKTAIDFPVEKFTRKKGKRTVLVELFTGAQCPPCVAADIAFDALEKSYKPEDVVLLQYHLHVPGADPLTNNDTEARQEYYGTAVRGTPAILFNGKASAPGGGGRDDAKDKFKDYQKVINPLLDGDATVKLSASAVRKGDKIKIQAKAQEVGEPSDKVRLRLALVEDWVRYKSPNGLAYHHRVVRALPGGAKGIALTKKDAEMSEEVDVAELQKGLSKYLDDFAKREEPFPDSQRPLRLRNLHVVAFVQNDTTNEVLQAIDVRVTDD